jgi:hypothetical protein
MLLALNSLRWSHAAGGRHEHHSAPWSRTMHGCRGLLVLAGVSVRLGSPSTRCIRDRCCQRCCQTWCLIRTLRCRRIERSGATSRQGCRPCAVLRKQGRPAPGGEPVVRSPPVASSPTPHGAASPRAPTRSRPTRWPARLPGRRAPCDGRRPRWRTSPTRPAEDPPTTTEVPTTTAAPTTTTTTNPATAATRLSPTARLGHNRCWRPSNCA